MAILESECFLSPKNVIRLTVNNYRTINTREIVCIDANDFSFMPYSVCGRVSDIFQPVLTFSFPCCGIYNRAMWIVKTLVLNKVESIPIILGINSEFHHNSSIQ